MYLVQLTKHAAKDLRKAPKYIVEQYNAWADQVEIFGLQTVRRQPGYHDEPLKGERQGQRSVRLNKQWRVIYVVDEQQSPVIISVLEVNAHEY